VSSPEFAANRDNYCYRHPDRQSFALCQRCLRTICGECQTPAPVGVICPECLAQAQKSATENERKANRSRPRPVAVYDGRPLVTYWLLGITSVVSLVAMLALPALQQALFFYAPLLYPQLTGLFEPWRLLSGLLVHGGWLHLALNMLSLFMIGRILEPLVGHARFLLLYLISGLGGFVGVALIAFTTPVVGASGAIFGMLGALLVIGRHLGAQISGILLVVGINLVIGFIPGFNVAWQAHVGGLIVGALVGLIYAQTRTRARRPLQIGLLVGLVVALLALLLVPPAIYG
jgi:membrane associated rhomboid family serine protease